jgi:protein-tyrosine-phosphatase
VAPDASKRAAENLISAGLDWKLVLEAALSHRVSPLLGRVVEEVGWDAVPSEFRSALQAHCEDNADRSLWLIAELLQILDELDGRGITAIPFKGPILGEVAYGDPRLHFIEGLDLRVPPEQAEEVCEALAAAGLREASELATGRRRSSAESAAYRRFQSECRFIRERDGLVIDVHWAVAPKNLAAPLDHRQLWQRMRRTSLLGEWLPGLDVPGLALEDLLLVLCIDGSTHEWSQLCWICDVAELIHRHPELDLRVTLERARAQGLERMVLVGLALARDLLGLSVPDVATRRLGSDDRALELSARAARQLFDCEQSASAVFELSPFRYWMRERARDRVRHVLYTLVTPTEAHVRLMALPRSLDFLYYVLTPLHDYMLLPAWRAAKRLLGPRGRRLARLLTSQQARDNARSAWRRRRRGTPAPPPDGVRRVLVVCSGNICRSPFGSELLASLQPELIVRSAGLEAGEGACADPMALRTAAAYAVDLRGHAAHALDAEDVRWADLILAMEGHHAARIARRWPEAQAKTWELGHFLPAPPHTIEDPWGRSEDFFAQSFERIALGLRRLSEQLNARGGP